MQSITKKICFKTYIQRYHYISKLDLLNQQNDTQHIIFFHIISTVSPEAVAVKVECPEPFIRIEDLPGYYHTVLEEGK